ncbi:unnamed protein product [Allacma fusca]|uniref:Uncharacterized protein n=1 Tax=Allacma fusca TaxID=39272 RepID=A0A8J2LW90_9HEXA|nr:unnamed protein product [Allacma fusca]
MSKFVILLTIMIALSGTEAGWKFWKKGYEATYKVVSNKPGYFSRFGTFLVSKLTPTIALSHYVGNNRSNYTWKTLGTGGHSKNGSWRQRSYGIGTGNCVLFPKEKEYTTRRNE